jgi:hemin uptake protein HemP
MAEALRDGREQPVLTGAKKPVRRIDVLDLLAGAREAVILHCHEEYRLRLTSNGKLILTK